MSGGRSQLFLRFPNQNFICIFHLSHAYSIVLLSLVPWFCRPNNIRRRNTVAFFPALFYLFLWIPLCQSVLNVFLRVLFSDIPAPIELNAVESSRVELGLIKLLTQPVQCEKDIQEFYEKQICLCSIFVSRARFDWTELATNSTHGMWETKFGTKAEQVIASFIFASEVVFKIS